MVVKRTAICRPLRIPWTANVSNNEIMMKVAEEKNYLHVVQQKLRYCGHWINHLCLQTEIRIGMVQGSRKRRRPGRSWIYDILAWTYLISAAGDRCWECKWQRRVEQVVHAAVNAVAAAAWHKIMMTTMMMMMMMMSLTSVASSCSVAAATEHWGTCSLNPLIATLKPQSNGPSYSNTEIGTLAVNGWPVTFGTARMGLGEGAARPVPSSLYPM